MSDEQEPPLIEHDPKEPVHDANSLPVGYVIGLFGIAAAAYLARNELPDLGWPDYLFFGLWIALLAWCFSPRRMRAVGDTEGSESARKSIAFRLGKKLKRVLHYGRRNTTA